MELGNFLIKLQYNSNDYPFHYQKGINIYIYIYILQSNTDAKCFTVNNLFHKGSN